MAIYRMVVLLFVSLLAGCASMSKDDCVNADWSKIGHDDGVKGQKPEAFKRYQSSCSKHGVTADANQYNKAWAQAIVNEYCTEERGFTLGRNGKIYRDVCPAEVEPIFLRGYKRGRQLYKAAEGHEQSMRSGRTGTEVR